MKKLNVPGRTLFAVAMAAFGIQYLMHALFAAVPPPGPPWAPTNLFWGYLTAIVLVVSAAGVGTGIQPRCAAIALALVTFIRVLLVYVPLLAKNIHDPGPWTSGAELLALGGAALVLAGVTKLGPITFAAPLVVFGVQHFMYAHFVATLVPSWIPGRLFWAYFVGASFIAAAFAISAQRVGRLAATLLGTMFLLWVFILHLPRVVGAAHNGNEWTSLFVALAMSGGAFLVAAPRKTAGSRNQSA